MGNEAVDQTQRWSDFLGVSKKLLTPNIGFVVSPDGEKIKVIDGGNSNSPLEYYDEKFAQFDLHCLRQRSPLGFNYSLLICPTCGKSYTISFKDHLPDDILSINSAVIYVKKDSFFCSCACGLDFVFRDRYKNVRIPFNLESLELLYQHGMSRTADLLVRYDLSADGCSLVEEIGEIAGPSNTPSLTADPLLQFRWTNPPCFTTDCGRLWGSVWDVQIWQNRIYVLGLDHFMVLTWNPDAAGWERKNEYHKGKQFCTVQAAQNDLVKSLALLESVVETKMKGSPGRPKGTGLFKSIEDFCVALRSVFEGFSQKPSEVQVIEQLRQHPLCQQKTSRAKLENQTRTLRDWIQKAEYNDFHDAWRKHLLSQKNGK